MEDDGTPCYKIEEEGRVTAYLTIVEKKTKKEVIYESKLILKKVREMTEIEIMAEKGEIEKKSIFDELNKKILKQ